MNNKQHHLLRAGISLVAVAAATQLSLGAVPAMAGEGYLGIGAGRSDSGSIVDEAKRQCADAGLSCSSKSEDKAYKAFGGYKFNPYIGVEAAFVDLGGISATAAATGSPKLSATVKGFAVTLVPAVPIGNGVSLFGKAGVFVWDAKLKATSDVFGLNETATDSSAGATIGAGAAINMNEQSAFRIEWERYSLDENFSSDKSSFKTNNDIDLISASLLFRFH